MASCNDASVPSLGVVHLSDVHLAGYERDAMFDVDSDIRHELELDLERVAEQAGGIGAIMIGGDIAGRGMTEEYDAAAVWIDHLCDILDVPPERVFCVPGNHDVLWSAITNDPVLGALQELLLTRPTEEIDARLEVLLTSGPHRGLLLGPLENYNRFAARYGCDVSPESHRWEQALTLGPLTIQVVGLTSALLSGPRDSRDASTSLLALGPQAVLRRHRDTLTILLCHHPLSWLRDRDRCEHYIDRAHLQLFGHEHTSQRVASATRVRVHAGAVHPPRGGTEPWEPAYNVIRIGVEADALPSVAIDVWPRRVGSKGQFEAEDPQEPMRSHVVELDLCSWTTDFPTAPPSTVLPGTDPPPAPTSAQERRAARRFAALSIERRLALGKQLALIDREDQDLDEGGRARAVFRRASQTGRLRELEESLGDESPT